MSLTANTATMSSRWVPLYQHHATRSEEKHLQFFFNDKIKGHAFRPTGNSGEPILPAMSNLFTGPTTAYSAVTDLQKDFKNGDKEGMLDTSFRFIGTPLSLGNSLGEIIKSIGKFKPVHAKGLVQFASAATFLGLGLCAVDAATESVGIKRQLQFLNSSAMDKALTKINPCREELEAWHAKNEGKNAPYFPVIDALVKSDLQGSDFKSAAYRALYSTKKNELKRRVFEIRDSYCGVTSKEISQINADVEKRFSDLPGEAKCAKKNALIEKKLHKKMANFARRVETSCAAKINTNIHQLCKRFNSPTLAVRKRAYQDAGKMLDTIESQSKQMLKVHIIGLIAVGIFALGLALVFAPIPWYIPLIITIIGFSIGRVRGKVLADISEKEKKKPKNEFAEYFEMLIRESARQQSAE